MQASLSQPGSSIIMNLLDTAEQKEMLETKIKQLQLVLKNDLAENQIKNIDELIQEMQILKQKHSKEIEKKKQVAARETKLNIEKYQRLLNIDEEIKFLKDKLINYRKIDIQNKLDQAMRKLQYESIDEVQEDLVETNKKIEEYKIKNRIKMVNEQNKKKQEIEKILSLHKQLTKQQQISSDSNKDKFEVIQANKEYLDFPKEISQKIKELEIKIKQIRQVCLLEDDDDVREQLEKTQKQLQDNVKLNKKAKIKSCEEKKLKLLQILQIQQKINELKLSNKKPQQKSQQKSQVIILQPQLQADQQQINLTELETEYKNKLDECQLQETDDLNEELAAIENDLIKYRQSNKKLKISDAQTKKMKIQHLISLSNKIKEIKHKKQKKKLNSRTINEEELNRLKEQYQSLMEKCKLDETDDLDQQLIKISNQLETFIKGNKIKKQQSHQILKKDLLQLIQIKRKIKNFGNQQDYISQNQIGGQQGDFRNQIQTKKIELETLCEEIGLDKDDDIEAYLKQIIIKIKQFNDKKQLKRAAEKEAQKQKILKIIDLRKKVKELQDTEMEKNVVNIERELHAGLQKYDIDENILEQEIKEAEKEWNRCKTQKRQKKAQQAQKKLNELKKLIEIRNQVQAVKAKIQRKNRTAILQTLKSELEAGLKQHDISSVEDLKVEIADKEKKIKQLTAKGRKAALVKQEQQRTKLVNLLKIHQQISKLEGESQSNQMIESNQQKQISSNSSQQLNQSQEFSQLISVSLSQAILELGALYEEIGLDKDDDIEAYLKQIIIKIKQFNDKKQLKRAAEKEAQKQKILKIIDLRKKVKELQDTEMEKNVVNIERELHAGLQKYDIDENILEQEIKEAEKEWNRCKTQKRQKKAQQAQKKLNELKKLIEIRNQVQAVKAKIQRKNRTAILQTLKSELEAGLKQHDISSVEDLKVEIADKEKKIKQLTAKGRKAALVKQEQQRTKLVNLLKIHQQISKLEGESQSNQMIESNQQKQISSEQSKISSDQSHNQNLQKPVIFPKDKEKISQRYDISGIPLSSEKLLFQLLNFTVQNIQTNHDAISLQNEFSNLNQFKLKFKQLKNRLATEELSNNQINVSMYDINKCLNEEINWKIILKSLKNILVQIRPLDLKQLSILVKKAREAAEMIKDKEILLFLGDTGSGKSTTIHFLAGSKMELIKQKFNDTFIEYISATEIRNPTLQKVKISYRATSQTRYITPIHIKFSDFNEYQTDQVYICDSPGFGDTAGYQVDIANTLGILQAIKNCKNIRIVVVSSALSMGDRGQGIRKLANIIVGMVKNIDDNLKSINYIYTKFPEKTTIKGVLSVIKQGAQKSEDKDNLGFKSLLLDMLKKSSRKERKINPLKDDPFPTLFQIYKETSPMYQPNKQFATTFTNQSLQAIFSQCRINQIYIASAIKRGGYDMVSYKLDQIQFLWQITSRNEVKQIYQMCIHDVVKMINVKFEAMKEKFSLLMNQQTQIVNQDLNEFINYFNQLNYSKLLRQKHLDRKTPLGESFIVYIREQIQKNASLFEEEELKKITKQNTLNLQLNNILLLCKNFKEIHEVYTNLVSNIAKVVFKFVKLSIKATKDQNWEEVAEYYIKVDILMKLQSHINNKDEINQAIKNSKQFLFKNIEEIQKTIILVIDKPNLSDNEIKAISQVIQKFQAIIENSSLKLHIDIGKVIAIKSNVIQKIIDKFETLYKKIIELFKVKDTNTPPNFLIVKQQIKFMQKLRQLSPSISNRTASKYYQTIQTITSFMKDVRRDIDDLSSELLSGRSSDNSNLIKIERCLKGLRNAKFMDEFSQGTYNQTLSNIKDNLVNHSKRLRLNCEEVEINLQKSQNIDKAIDLIRKMEKLMQFEQDFPEIRPERQFMIKAFISEVLNNLSILKKTFDLDSHNIEHQYELLKSLQNIESKYHTFHNKFKVLQQAGVDTFQKLKDKLSLLDKQYGKSTTNRGQVITKKKKELQRFNNINKIYFQKMQKEEYDSAKKYLSKEAKCKNHDELLKNIQTQTDSIKQQNEAIQVQKQEFLKNRKVLNEIIQAYKKYENQTKNEDGDKYLFSMKFQSKKDLDNAIQKKKKQIQKYQSTKQKYIVDKLDSKLATQGLNYCQYCIKIRNIQSNQDKFLQIKNSATQIKNSIDLYIVNYIQMMSQQIDRSIIQLNRIKAIEDIQSIAESISQNLDQIKNLEKYTPIFQKIKGKELMQRWKTQIHKHFTELQSDMQKNLTPGQMRDKVEIAKTMRCVDKFIDKSYYELHREKASQVTGTYKDIYKKIRAFIQAHNFQAVDMEFIDVDENPIPVNVFNDLKSTLSFTITQLIQKTRLKSIMLNVTQTDSDVKFINEICTNLNKIDAAKKYFARQQKKAGNDKPSFKNILDNELIIKLKTSTDQIRKIISNKIKNFLIKIEAAISAQDFADAEARRQVINNLIQIIDIQQITQGVQKINAKIEQVVTKIISEYKTLEYKHYLTRPPKRILEKLEKVRKYGQKYNEAYNQINDSVIEKITKTIEQAQSDKLKLNERKKRLEEIVLVLHSLPQLQAISFKERINHIKQSLTNSEKYYKQEVTKIQTVNDPKQLKKFVNKIKDEGAGYQIEEQTKKMITLKNDGFNDQIIKALGQSGTPDIKSASRNIKKLQEFTSQFKEIIPQLQTNHTKMKKTYEKSIRLETQKFKSLQNIEQIRNALSNLNIFMEFKKQMETYQRNYFKQIDQPLNKMIKGLETHFTEIQVKYQQGAENMDFDQLKPIFSNLKQYSRFIVDFRNYVQNHYSREITIINITRQLNYENIISETTSKLEKIKVQIIQFKFLKQFQQKRNQYYTNLNTKLQIMKNVHKLGQFISQPIVNCYKKECIPIIQKKFDSSINQAIEIFKKSKIQLTEFDSFNLSYNNLVSFTNKVKIIQFEEFQKKKQNIEKKVQEKINEYVKICESDKAEISSVANNLIQMKYISENVPLFSDKINVDIDNSIKKFINNHKKQGGRALATLAQILKDDARGIGRNIIDQHSTLKGESISIFNKEIQSHDIEYILKNIEGDELDIQQLRKKYDIIIKKYRQIVQEYLVRYQKLQVKAEFKRILQGLIANTKKIAITTSLDKGLVKWSGRERDIIIQLISHIFALWTLNNIQFYEAASQTNAQQRKNYLIQPHPGQIVSILRILTVGYKSSSNNLLNNLIQIGTGQGKSVTLAVTSIILALMGCEVSCACYSKYLSQRDYQSFKALFDAYGLTKNIHYGTFNQICESQINDRGDIRQRLLNIITNSANKGKNLKQPVDRPKVLLIDEVDVFFNKDFYGNIYTPLARLKDQSIINLTKYIWSVRTTSPRLKTIQARPQYQACVNRFKQYEFLIKQSVKDMLADLSNYNHDYIVHNDKIAYKQQDGLVYNVVYGYKTMFAYYHENEKKKISDISLNQNISIGIRCGSFSYAEIPYKFNNIMGVTGTLKTLSKYEQYIVKQIYKIVKFTYIPSVFGSNKREFAKIYDVYVQNKLDHKKQLRQHISNSLRDGKRAVLVFFPTQKQLRDALDSKQFKELIGMGKNIQILTQQSASSPKQKEAVIKRATSAGQITFLTRVFGRGVDFICRDQTVLQNKGVHVVSTFFSQEYSQEIQIMGRSARQGQDGSFGMVLLDEDLQKFLGVDYKNILINLRNQKKLYDGLHERRIAIFEERYKQTSDHIAFAKKQHTEALQFVEAINKMNIEYLKSYLKARNQGAPQAIDCKMMVLMDATGSMSSLLYKAKQNVKIMFERTGQILKNSGFKQDCFKLQFVVYRDYDQGINGILQYSPWQTQPINLRTFMDKINACGGGDYEQAIEIGFWHANQQNVKQPISQIILIADAPAKTPQQISSYRTSYLGQAAWRASKYGVATHYTTELQKLKTAKIPVHALYLQAAIKTHFEQIANATGGGSFYLDVNNDGAQKLTEYVSIKILKYIGQSTGKSDELAKKYRQKFGSRTHA